jgi:hypothetical protein
MLSVGNIFFAGTGETFSLYGNCVEGRKYIFPGLAEFLHDAGIRYEPCSGFSSIFIEVPASKTEAVKKYGF